MHCVLLENISQHGDSHTDEWSWSPMTVACTPFAIHLYHCPEIIVRINSNRLLIRCNGGPSKNSFLLELVQNINDWWIYSQAICTSEITLHPYISFHRLLRWYPWYCEQNQPLASMIVNEIQWNSMKYPPNWACTTYDLSSYWNPWHRSEMQTPSQEEKCKQTPTTLTRKIRSHAKRSDGITDTSNSPYSSGNCTRSSCTRDAMLEPRFLACREYI